MQGISIMTVGSESVRSGRRVVFRGEDVEEGSGGDGTYKVEEEEEDKTVGRGIRAQQQRQQSRPLIQQHQHN